YDESFSILFSEKGLSAMMYGTLQGSGGGAADIHPLGYYASLWAWMKLFGGSIVSARIFSVLVGTASLALIYAIARAAFDEETALFSLAFASALPFQIHFSQEVRMYALLSLSLLAAVYSYLRAVKGDWKWWILFAISSAAAQYIHNLAAIHLAVFAFTPLAQKNWKALKAFLLAAAFAVLLYLPWLIHLPSQVSKVQSFYWVERPGVEKVFTLFLVYLSYPPLPGKWLAPVLLLSTLVVTLAAYQTYLAWRKKLPSWKSGLWTAFLAFASPLLLWLISQFVPIYIERALLPSHAMFCVWLGWAAVRGGIPKPARVFLLVSVFIAAAAGFFPHVHYTGFPYADFAALDRRIASARLEGDAIVHSSKLSYLPAFYFNAELPQLYIADPPASPTDTLAPATREVLKVRFEEDIQSAAAGKRRVWFIVYQQSLEEYKQAGLTHPHLEYLEENFSLLFVEEWGDLRLYLFEKKSAAAKTRLYLQTGECTEGAEITSMVRSICELLASSNSVKTSKTA
ncbi:MAG: glycosyltransferase family 39 protein, partial [Chloroflexi bacterium]|nr:glycosyltransferase family 39 protein [Chloroflexota bacterium]